MIQEPEYDYGGQWFDDLGAGVASFTNAPMLGFDIASTPGLSRGEINESLAALLRSRYNPYEE